MSTLTLDSTVISLVTLILSALIFVIVLILMFTGGNKNRKLNVAKLFASKKKYVAEKVYDRQEVCEKVSIAVQTLSKSKTGALITFEKGDKFTEIVKSGTVLNAPITPELLTTIFYPGTRLHDGAVVIRRDEILAASVYYTPTTRPLTGKFGSRHRAAIGISELTDSVTVIVSEETGRISIAFKGELIPVAQDNFLRTLEDYLINEPAEGEEEKFWVDTLVPMAPVVLLVKKLLVV